MFDVGLPELAVIAVVAIIMFGPDRLPDYARQAARLIRQLRRLADSAQDDLRRELGPEYADLELTDLDPRELIRRHLAEAIEAEDKAEAVGDRTRWDGPPLAAGDLPPFDTEAT